MRDIFLGIDTSCDDTSIALYFSGSGKFIEERKTQDVHEKFKGVVPELASRDHLETLPVLLDSLLEKAHIEPFELAGIGVTYKPGLIGSILVGLSFAKAYAYSLSKPFIGIDHIEGHLFSAFLNNTKPEYPFLGVVLSGGHSEIFLVKNFGDYELISTTVDDAAGEVLDKMARYMDIGFPGGPAIEKIAINGDRKRFSFPLPIVKQNDNYFSFSGIKTAALAYFQKEDNPDDKFKSDLAASFQDAVIRQVIDRLKKALNLTKCHRIVMGGGVTANTKLRNSIIEELGDNAVILIPDIEYCTDNASMIAQLSAWKIISGNTDELSIEAHSISDLGNYYIKKNKIGF